jgi:hypothetical protein
MIKINDRFQIERRSECWVLHDFRETDHHKSKTGISHNQTYFMRLHNVVNEILERAPEGAESLADIVKNMELIRDDIWRMIAGLNSKR